MSRLKLHKYGRSRPKSNSESTATAKRQQREDKRNKVEDKKQDSEKLTVKYLFIEFRNKNQKLFKFRFYFETRIRSCSNLDFSTVSLIQEVHSKMLEYLPQKIATKLCFLVILMLELMENNSTVQMV